MTKTLAISIMFILSACGSTAQSTRTASNESSGDTCQRLIDLAQICAGVTIGWLELRANVLGPIGDIRATRPKLFRWYEAFRQRPSMKATEPHT